MKLAPKAALGAVAAVVLASGAAGFGLSSAVADRKPQPVVQNDFDALGAPMHALAHDGRTVHFSDTGERGGIPVLYMSGTGTTARSQDMTEFLRTTRKNLNIRMISVERNGFGDTEYDPKLGFDDYTSDVTAVLDKLGIARASVVAISGGGPYAAHFASAEPNRIASLHLAAALAPYGATSLDCSLSQAELEKKVAPQIRDPRQWWAFPDDSPVKQIPGFTDTAEEDGARTYYQRGQLADPAPQAHEQRLYCERPGPDLSKVTAPAYVYTGAKDTTVPPSVQALWGKELPHQPTVRTYADSGHDVQYRHWDQVLLDIAGYADRRAVCVNGRTKVLPQAKADPLIAKGAVAGGCAWKK